jgi:hypothetical protein
MLIIKVSSNRLLMVDEYWILIPLVGSVYHFILHPRLKKYFERKAIEEQQAIASLEQEEELIRKWRLEIRKAQLRLYLNSLSCRGGDDSKDSKPVAVEQYQQLEQVLGLIDVAYPKCEVPRGLSYINSPRVRKFIINQYNYKQKRGVILITKTALCHLIKKYGLAIPGLGMIIFPFPLDVGLYPMITSWIDVVRKFLITGFGVYLLYSFSYQVSTISSLFQALALVAEYGLWSMDPAKMSTGFTPIDNSAKEIKVRYLDGPEVVAIDKTATTQTQVTNQYECLIPGQSKANKVCNGNANSILDVIEENPKTYPNLPNPKYTDAVNMQDVTTLDIDFNDICEVENTKPVCFPNKIKNDLPISDDIAKSTLPDIPQSSPVDVPPAGPVDIPPGARSFSPVMPTVDEIDEFLE